MDVFAAALLPPPAAPPPPPPPPLFTVGTTPTTTSRAGFGRVGSGNLLGRNSSGSLLGTPQAAPSAWSGGQQARGSDAGDGGLPPLAPPTRVSVMLPLDTVSAECVFRYAAVPWFTQALHVLAASGVHSVAFDVWWGAVEREPRQYNWSAYKQLMAVIKPTGLKVQVVLSFHACGGNVGDTAKVPLPNWVLQAGQRDPDLFFTDRPRGRAPGSRNREYISIWSDDEAGVLCGRSPMQCYEDLMSAFREAFEQELGTVIDEIVVGSGPCGELRYPAYLEGHGWKFPGIGEFQCYDRRALASLASAARAAGHPEWGASGPHDAGEYNSAPESTGFFRVDGTWNSPYGRFFMDWYSGCLLRHGDRLLAAASLTLLGTQPLQPSWVRGGSLPDIHTSQRMRSGGAYFMHGASAATSPVASGGGASLAAAVAAAAPAGTSALDAAELVARRRATGRSSYHLLSHPALAAVAEVMSSISQSSADSAAGAAGEEERGELGGGEGGSTGCLAAMGGGGGGGGGLTARHRSLSTSAVSDAVGRGMDGTGPALLCVSTAALSDVQQALSCSPPPAAEGSVGRPAATTAPAGRDGPSASSPLGASAAAGASRAAAWLCEAPVTGSDLPSTSTPQLAPSPAAMSAVKGRGALTAEALRLSRRDDSGGEREGLAGRDGAGAGRPGSWLCGGGGGHGVSSPPPPPPPPPLPHPIAAPLLHAPPARTVALAPASGGAAAYYYDGANGGISSVPLLLAPKTKPVEVHTASPVLLPGAVTLTLKVAGVHWCFHSASHAAEVTAGYGGSGSRDAAYRGLVATCAKHRANLTLTCVEMCDAQHPPAAGCGPEGLLKQLRTLAARRGVSMSGENALPIFLPDCVDSVALERVVANVRAVPAASSLLLASASLTRMGSASPRGFLENGLSLGRSSLGSGTARSSSSSLCADGLVSAVAGGQGDAGGTGSGTEEAGPVDIAPLRSFTMLRMGPELLRPSHQLPWLRFMQRMTQSG